MNHRALRKETDVLTPLEPAFATEQHENDWDEFVLQNATVVDSSGKPVSLLAASEKLRAGYSSFACHQLKKQQA